MITIGIDASRANLLHRTGTEWYSFAVITRLMQLIPPDIQVRLYTKDPLLPDWPPLPDNWQHRPLRWPPGLLWTQVRLSWHLLWHRIDLLYVPAHTLPIIHPRRMVTVIHDVGFAHTTEIYNNNLIGGKGLLPRLLNSLVRLLSLGRYSTREQDYHQFAVKHALRSGAALITVSNFSRAEIERYYDVSPDRLHVIYNGYDPVPAPSSPSSAVASLVGQRYLLYVGRLEAKKNTPLLVEAFAKLVTEYGYDGQLVLAGSPGYQHDVIQSLITTHSLQDRVTQTGWVSEADRGWLLHHAEAFVFPSRYEGFGIPLLEAMSAGVPIVASDIPVFQEVAGSAALLCDTLSDDVVANLAASLHRITTDQGLRDRLIAEGLRRCRDYSWDTTAVQTWTVMLGTINKISTVR